MILLQASGIQKSFGTDSILTNINLEVQSGERVALVGRNGCGKSTLLKIITGVEPYDAGELSFGKDVSIGYLEQNSTLQSSRSIYQELESVFAELLEKEKRLRVLEQEIAKDHSEKRLEEYDRLLEEFTRAGGYTYHAEIQSVMHGLGFQNYSPDTPIGSLSGGQKTRISLGKLLLKKPDLLILDEPTNHLDIETLTWLENYLRHYPGAILVVSHDRYFLDKLVNKIYEISRGVSHRYTGNYSAYLQQKAADYERQMKLYEKQQKEIKNLEDFIQRNIARASTTKRAQSRRKKLEKMTIIERPKGDDKTAGIRFDIKKISGNDVLSAQDLIIGYGDKAIAKRLSFRLYREDSVALVGPNGMGKTTLLKTIIGALKPLEGSIRLGANVSIGYFDQEQKGLTPNKTVLNELWDDYPLMNEEDIRTALGSFLFTGDDVLKTVASLSGGERARLALAKLMMRRDNFLILDEPTNHLDLPSKEALEAALIDFPGTLLFVSHDRYFINRIATKVWELSSNGLTEYLGDYDYYVEKKAEQEELRKLQQENAPTRSAKSAEPMQDSYEETKRKKQEERKRQRRIAELEEEISSLETAVQALEQQLLDPDVYMNHEKATEVNDQLSAKKSQLEALIDEWTELQS
ncbi:ATP-binding cassette domain-containing protein [Tuberibacillus calidus]|jgi:ATP-binding cassette subfamily F protein 3|uniref:ABC transporter ATP-binding protein n=1 Tax=Tuberibacillus calidus TaxID=340097 RepID=UPI0003FFC680|nr:ATP-binding cassette domain-containing protein [Tuberibacillus calidus]